MFQQQSFTHHGHAFTIESEDWPNEEAACAAVIDLQMWAMRFNAEETAGLHGALRRETEALVHDAAYDRDAAPLPSVRAAQRHAISAVLRGQGAIDRQPILSIEAATT